MKIFSSLLSRQKKPDQVDMTTSDYSRGSTYTAPSSSSSSYTGSDSRQDSDSGTLPGHSDAHDSSTLSGNSDAHSSSTLHGHSDAHDSSTLHGHSDAHDSGTLHGHSDAHDSGTLHGHSDAHDSGDSGSSNANGTVVSTTSSAAPLSSHSSRTAAAMARASAAAARLAASRDNNDDDASSDSANVDDTQTRNGSGSRGHAYLASIISSSCTFASQSQQGADSADEHASSTSSSAMNGASQDTLSPRATTDNTSVSASRAHDNPSSAHGSYEFGHSLHNSAHKSLDTASVSSGQSMAAAVNTANSSSTSSNGLEGTSLQSRFERSSIHSPRASDGIKNLSELASNRNRGAVQRAAQHMAMINMRSQAQLADENTVSDESYVQSDSVTSAPHQEQSNEETQSLSNSSNSSSSSTSNSHEASTSILSNDEAVASRTSLDDSSTVPSTDAGTNGSSTDTGTNSTSSDAGTYGFSATDATSVSSTHEKSNSSSLTTSSSSSLGSKHEGRTSESAQSASDYSGSAALAETSEHSDTPAVATASKLDNSASEQNDEDNCSSVVHQTEDNAGEHLAPSTVHTANESKSITASSTSSKHDSIEQAQSNETAKASDTTERPRQRSSLRKQIKRIRPVEEVSHSISPSVDIGTVSSSEDMRASDHLESHESSASALATEAQASATTSLATDTHATADTSLASTDTALATASTTLDIGASASDMTVISANQDASARTAAETSARAAEASARAAEANSRTAAEARARTAAEAYAGAGNAALADDEVAAVVIKLPDDKQRARIDRAAIEKEISEYRIERLTDWDSDIEPGQAGDKVIRVACNIEQALRLCGHNDSDCKNYLSHIDSYVRLCEDRFLGRRYAKNAYFLNNTLEAEESYIGDAFNNSERKEHTILELLQVLASQDTQAPLQASSMNEYGQVSYDRHRRGRLRRILFNNPFLNSISHNGSINDKDCWDSWAAQYNNLNADDPNGLISASTIQKFKEQFGKFSNFEKAVNLMRSWLIDYDSKRQWATMFLFPFGTNALYKEIDKKYISKNNIFSGQGDLVFSMLQRASNSPYLTATQAKQLLGNDELLDKLSAAMRSPNQTTTSIATSSASAASSGDADATTVSKASSADSGNAAASAVSADSSADSGDADATAASAVSAASGDADSTAVSAASVAAAAYADATTNEVDASNAAYAAKDKGENALAEAAVAAYQATLMDVGKELVHRFFNDDDVINIFAGYINDSEMDANDQSGFVSTVKTSYLPYVDLPVFERLKEDFTNLLHCPLNKQKLFIALARMASLNLLVYLLEQEQKMCICYDYSKRTLFNTDKASKASSAAAKATGSAAAKAASTAAQASGTDASGAAASAAGAAATSSGAAVIAAADAGAEDEVEMAMQELAARYDITMPVCAKGVKENKDVKRISKERQLFNNGLFDDSRKSYVLHRAELYLQLTVPFLRHKTQLSTEEGNLVKRIICAAFNYTPENEGKTPKKGAGRKKLEWDTRSCNSMIETMQAKVLARETHMAGLSSMLAAQCGMSKPTKTGKANYEMSDELLRTLVMAVLGQEECMKLSHFLDIIRERYHIVIGPTDSGRHHSREDLENSTDRPNFQANLTQLKLQLHRLDMLINLSDYCEYIRRP